MEYRLLLPDEYEKARTLLGDHLPSPETSAIAGAFKDNVLIGVLVLQLQWHLEPLVITDPSVNFLRLKQILDQGLRNSGGGTYYAFTSSEQVMNMALRSGMEVQPVMTLKGTVESLKSKVS